jgi:small conductance mechanosensitive channel
VGPAGQPLRVASGLAAAWDWVQTAWDRAGGAAVLIALTIVGALVLRWLANRLIHRLVAAAATRQEARIARLPGLPGRVLVDVTGLANERHLQRTTTMGAILRSIVTFVVVGIAALTIMSIIGLPLGPLLASAGVGGVALGFGAQSLVKDFLSGVFMIVEDQYGVGDVVDTGSVTGTVEDVTLRITRIRDGNGVVWYVRNGEILRIGNKSQGWSTAVVDVQVAYDQDLARVNRIITEVVGDLGTTEPWSSRVLEEPSVVGIEAMTGDYVTLRVSAKCVANENVAVQREIRERVKAAFDANGIVVPSPPPMPPYSGGVAAPPA